MHNFIIVSIDDGMTIMFCSKCGKSYKLAIYGYGGATKAWKKMEFRGSDDQLIDAPTQDCALTPEIESVEQKDEKK